jgi:hypothetical protein
MENNTQCNLSFLEWSKRVNSQHPDILEHMQKSIAPLNRVIAKRIIQTAGVDEE